MSLKSKHILSYCELCQTEMVVCATCGNNSCNATHGQVDGKECPDCASAYEVQAQHWEHPGSVEFAEDRRVKAEKRPCWLVGPSWSLGGENEGKVEIVRGMAIGDPVDGIQMVRAGIVYFIPADTVFFDLEAAKKRLAELTGN